MIYVRWKRGEPRRRRTFPPLSAGHPSAGNLCPGCDQLIGTRLPAVLVAVGPADDGDREDHDAGRWYSAGAALFHEPCADIHGEAGLDRVVSELAIRDSS